MTVAFVLSGGGSLGAVQVGMLRALAERKVVPDLLVGTSVGALNAAFIAAHGAGENGVEALAGIWATLHTRAVFTIDPLQVLAAVAGRRDAICSNAGLLKLLEEHVSFGNLEEAPIPLVVVATDLLSGTEVAFAGGPVVPAVLGSCAIPGVFPTVAHEGITLVDGGLADNTAISQAVERGADTIYVLPSGYSCALATPPSTALGVATHAVALLIHQRLVADIALYASRADLVVLPPPCPLPISPTDFGHAGELMHEAYIEALATLAVDAGRRAHPDRLIALHTHRKHSRGG